MNGFMCGICHCTRIVKTLSKCLSTSASQPPVAPGYDPSKVHSLEVLTTRYIKGNFVYNGIVSMTTYYGDMQDLKLDPKTVMMDYEGLQLQREFYAPGYKTEQQDNSRMPDFRNLLWWSPNVETDQTGQANIEIYTSDIKGNMWPYYRV
jgi:hypothetical protein